jgi:hypothetical protein
LHEVIGEANPGVQEKVGKMPEEHDKQSPGYALRSSAQRQHHQQKLPHARLAAQSR